MESAKEVFRRSDVSIFWHGCFISVRSPRDHIPSLQRARILWMLQGGKGEGEILANSQKVASGLSSDNACASPVLITRSLDYLGRQLMRLILVTKFSATCWDYCAFVNSYKISLNAQFIGMHNYSALRSFSYFLGIFLDGTGTFCI